MRSYSTSERLLRGVRSLVGRSRAVSFQSYNELWQNLVVVKEHELWRRWNAVDQRVVSVRSGRCRTHCCTAIAKWTVQWMTRKYSIHFAALLGLSSSWHSRKCRFSWTFRFQWRDLHAAAAPAEVANENSGDYEIELLCDQRTRIRKCLQRFHRQIYTFSQNLSN